MKASVAFSMGVAVAAAVGSVVFRDGTLLSGLDRAVRSFLRKWSAEYGAPRRPAPSIGRREAERVDADECLRRIRSYMGAEESDPLAGLSVVLHRNGEAEPCHATDATTDLVAEINGTLQGMEYCPVSAGDEKYEFESFLSRLLHRLASTCASPEVDRTAEDGFLGYCDMGPQRTPVLMNHEKLVPIRADAGARRTAVHLPCHFHLRYGVRVTSFGALAAHARRVRAEGSASGECATSVDRSRNQTGPMVESPGELHLFAVPAGRVFMFAPSYVNEIIHLPHVTGADPAEPVYLQCLSLRPRVLEIFNFFSRDESADLVRRALAETRDSHRIKRSSTGATGYSVNAHRTSESGYDTAGETAMAIKRRCFDVLGFDQYLEEHADGLQILRYNTSTSYRSHYDYMEGSDALAHDFDSAHRGGNRFATILLYMTDMEAGAGGETVFTDAWPQDLPEEERLDHGQALAALRASGDAAIFERDSWQEDMVARCRSRLAVACRAGRSILFYSQLPNGQMDGAALHGGCPVLRGTKYAANLWVWNTARQGYPGAPKNPRYRPTSN